MLCFLCRNRHHSSASSIISQSLSHNLKTKNKSQPKITSFMLKMDARALFGVGDQERKHTKELYFEQILHQNPEKNLKFPKLNVQLLC